MFSSDLDDFASNPDYSGPKVEPKYIQYRKLNEAKQLC